MHVSCVLDCQMENSMRVAVLTRASAILALLAMVMTGCGSGGDTETFSQASMAPADSYMTHRNWGILPDGRAWGRVSGIYIDPNGRDIWVHERCGGDDCIDSKDPPVMRFDTEGSLLTSFGADMFVRPHGLYVDGEGNVWATDGRAARPAELERAPGAAQKGNQVVKFSPTGEVLMVLGTPGKTGVPPTPWISRTTSLSLQMERFSYQRVTRMRVQLAASRGFTRTGPS